MTNILAESGTPGISSNVGEGTTTPTPVPSHSQPETSNPKGQNMNNNYSINAGHTDRPQDLSRLATILRRFKLNINETITNGPPTTYVNGAHTMIDNVAPHRDHMEDAAQAVLQGQDPTEHLVLHAAWHFRPGLAERIQNSGRRDYINRLNTNADTIIKAVRKEVFDPAIKALKALAEKNPEAVWDIETAINIGDYEQAARIRDVSPNIVRRLADAIELRTLLHPEAFDTDAAWATKPGSLDILGGSRPKSIEWWMYLMQNGYTPSYPTLTEWERRNENEDFTAFRDAIQAPEVEVTQLGFIGR